MGEVENKIENKMQIKEKRPARIFNDAEDILFKKHNNAEKVIDLMRDEKEYMPRSMAKLSLDERIEEPPKEKEEKKAVHEREIVIESRIKNYRFVNPLVDADKYAFIETESEKIKNRVKEGNKNTVAFLLKDKTIKGDVRRLLEDVKEYLSKDYDPITLEKKTYRLNFDGKHGLNWLFNSFTHKQRFSRKTQSQKLLYLKAEIEKLGEDNSKAAQFLKGWLKRMSETKLKFNEEEVVDATKARFVHHDKNKNVEEGKTKPVSTKDRRGVPLFPQEPSLRDVSQGNLGDCYFLANIAAIVSSRPDEIRNMMKDEGDTVVVRFYSRVRKVGGSDIKPVYIRVDKQVPQGFAAHCLWVQILEKAFTAYYGMGRKLENVAEIKLDKNLENKEVNYGDIAGGFTADSFLMLTGKEIEANLSGNSVRANRIDSLFEAMTTDHLSAPGYLKVARALPAKLRAIKAEYEKKIGDICNKLGVNLALKEEHAAKLKRWSELVTSGVDEDSENLELAEEYKQIGQFNREHQAELAEIDKKLNASKEYQDTYAEMQSAMNEAHAETEAELNKGGYTLGVSAPSFIMHPKAEEDMKIFMYDNENMQKLIKLARPRDNSDDSNAAYLDKIALNGKYHSICTTLLRLAAERAGVQDLHGVFKNTKRNGRVLQGFKQVASIEDYREAIAKIREYVEKDDSIFTIENIPGELSDTYTEEAVESGELKQVYKDILLSGLKYLEDNFENQTLITHKPLSNQYTKAAKIKYKEIEKAIDKGKVVTFDTKKNLREGLLGKNGESYYEGLHDGHVYTILGVEKIGDRLFVRARNPWGVDITKYTAGKNGKVKYSNNKSFDRNGIGLIEFNHFLARSSGYYIQK